MKVLLLSAYDADSHKRWHQGLVNCFSEYDWTILSLPARYFSWRVRGNSMYWAFQERETLAEDYDLIVATSMVDLSALRGFVPSLGRCPTLVYFHENQFAYPPNERQFSSVEPQVLNLYTALSADKLVFNSHYNRETFLHGVQQLLLKLPDCVPPSLVSRLEGFSETVPVALEANCFIESEKRVEQPLTVVWNHRWEYDKAPERLFLAIKRVLSNGVQINIHVMGQQFRQIPAIFEQMKMYCSIHHPEVIKSFGFVSSVDEYRKKLSQSDVVISTAIHDFQGLSVLEAVAAGCIPLVPDRLCYGEWFDRQYLYPSCLDDADEESIGLAEQLVRFAKLKAMKQLPLPPSVHHLSTKELKSDYVRIFEETVNLHSHQPSEPVL